MTDDLRQQNLLDRLDDMLANLQAHIELRAHGIAAPRIADIEKTAAERVAQAEEERDHWRTRFTDLQREHQRQVDVLNRRATRAEAAVARVRRLCDLTIAASCRVQAIEQARDTLAVLDDREPSRD